MENANARNGIRFQCSAIETPLGGPYVELSGIVVPWCISEGCVNVADFGLMGEMESQEVGSNKVRGDFGVGVRI